FTLYPNPARNRVTLDLKEKNPENLSLQVVDIRGRKVYQTQRLTRKTTLKITDWFSGVYFLKLLKHGKLVATKKLIKR
ncbi:MAG TPA: T9SS type A sorting domain-containing protein, partial [Balneolaceae bacterium]|nr:T9SS type A sorting domain-containing protein [Balneolaceae bacterium]